MPVLQAPQQQRPKAWCTTCKVKEGKPRTDRGLPVGIHCDSCWTRMVSAARSRSW